ncbi:response regulator transcription factor [Dokdonella sp.]|uniref:response regulator transcription factor n=1 Tax=Dokdonella sp. TaxID=2291710 RepID=UPI0031BBD9FA|nr:response regulator [Dokdonella sp.]
MIDDDADVRTSLTRLARSAGWDCAAFATAQHFLDEASFDEIGCVLLDVSMPGMTGPELHAQLLARGCGLPLIYLTGHGSVAIGVKAMRLGAFDFLEKPVDAEVLLPLLEAAIDQHADRCHKERHLHEIRERLATLSPREREVMDHVILGRLNKQIADDLDISLKTVKVHRGRAMTKMQVRSVAELVHLCDVVGERPQVPRPVD